jgi:hypothetical protein
MELLLNLIWTALAIAAFAAFAIGHRRSSSWIVPSPYAIALCGLACVVVLLFPVVSATDDLHPTQAMVEDAAKRVRTAIVHPHAADSNHPGAALLPVLLATWLSLALFEFRSFLFLEPAATPIQGVLARQEGRAPPSRG